MMAAWIGAGVGAVVLAAGAGDCLDLVRVGGGPARGVLVNCTAGARPFDLPDPGRPTVVFVHGINPAPHFVRFAMAEEFGRALARRRGQAAGFNALGWDWNAATLDSLRPRVNDANAAGQGLRLAEALLRAGLDPARIHLIGHSSGGIVATAAARALIARTGRRAAQLTLLEPAACYHDLIFARLAAGSAAGRVENYWSPGLDGFGRSVTHPGVFNGRIDRRPTALLDPRHPRHVHVVAWYLATAADPTTPGGFNASALLRGE